MMTPYTDAYAMITSCIIPVMAGMLGALILGGLIGWLYSPGPLGGTPAVRAKMDDLRKRLAETEEKLALAGTIMQKRHQEREEESARSRIALEKEVMSLNTEVTNLKMALTAAKRVVPERSDPAVPHLVEKSIADATHLKRIAALEKEAARVPELLRELEELRKSPKERAVGAAKPKALPTQVYRVMSESFGKKIAQDDLQLVEGIGPKIQEQLKKNGLKTWADVAAAKPEDLKKVLAKAGDRFTLHDPSSWPQQCKLMAEHRWDELRKYQRKLSTAR